MKNSRRNKSKEASKTSGDDENLSSCETRRKIEDVHEMRRYQDELGCFEEEAFELA